MNENIHPPTLVFDVGNSNIKWGMFQHGQLCYQLTSMTQPRQTADEYGLLYRGWLGSSSIIPQRVAISSVVPAVTSQLVRMCKHQLGCSPLIVDTHTDCALQLDTERPNELGSDLIVNAAAAYQECRQSCIVVAFGTAITFVGVDGDARLRGVAIMAGLETTLQALVQKTAMLSQVPLEQPPSRHLGRNTSEALRSGIIGGTLGAISHLIAGIKEEIGPQSITLATGYHAAIFAQLSPAIDRYRPQLTMKGLYFISQRQPFSP